MIPRLHQLLLDAGLPVEGVSGDEDGVRVDYLDATPEQVLQGEAIVAAFDWSEEAEAAFTATKERTRAESALDQPSVSEARLVRALALMVLDEFNLHSTRLQQMLSAIADATSLADLKTRMGQINAIPQRTPAQVVAAIKAKL
jgi:hypothetical protein